MIRLARMGRPILTGQGLALLAVVLAAGTASASFDIQETKVLQTLFPEGQPAAGGLGQAYWDLGGGKAISEKNLALLRADFDGQGAKETFVAFSLLEKYDPAADNFLGAIPQAALLLCGGASCEVRAKQLKIADEGLVRSVDTAQLKQDGQVFGLVVIDSGAAPIKTMIAAIGRIEESGELTKAALIVRDDPEDGARTGEVRFLDMDADGLAELVYHGTRAKPLDAYNGEKGGVMGEVHHYDRTSGTFSLTFRVQVSSVYQEKKDDTWTHGPLMMFDGDPKTAWCEGTKEYGISEYVRLDYSEKQDFTTVQLLPGWGLNAKTYLSHNQVKTFMLESASPKKFGYTFPESKRELQPIELLRPISTNWARLWIQEIYSARINATCISEFVLE